MMKDLGGVQIGPEKFGPNGWTQFSGLFSISREIVRST